MKINFKNSDKALELMENADGFGGILAMATQENEYWFTVGWFKTINGAIRSAKKRLAVLGYELEA